MDDLTEAALEKAISETKGPISLKPTHITVAKKPPRKPRPSELAKKAAKAAGKAQEPKPAKKAKAKAAAKRKPSKPAKKTTRPTKAKNKPAKKAKAAKKPLVKSKAPKKSGNGRTLVRTERLDFRVTKAEKTKLLASAKRQKRTITSLLQEFAAKVK